MILDEGANATLVETFISPNNHDASVVCSAANVVANSNAKATRILVQDLNLDYTREYRFGLIQKSVFVEKV